MPIVLYRGASYDRSPDRVVPSGETSFAGASSAGGAPPAAGPSSLRRRLLAALPVAGLAACATPGRDAPVSPDTFEPLLKAAHRRPANVARDPYRHPAQTLAFFGVRADSVVVEILPGSAGYYLEILAPYLRERGRYIAAGRDDAAPPAYLADHDRLLARLRAEPLLYDRVLVTQFNAGRHPVAPPASADFVLTFRNLHNWLERDEAEASLATFRAALKPGGVLGVVDHRGRPGPTQAAQMKSGYVREDFAVALIERAGFRLAGASPVNDNPRDTKDHPEGVWTLPPSYRLGAVDRAKYAAIGESDRFTLKFVKT